MPALRTQAKNCEKVEIHDLWLKEEVPPFMIGHP